MKEVVLNPPAEYRKVNVEGNLPLARLAAEAGVRRFVLPLSASHSYMDLW
jgi:nucleoside-diphosphate-sugar epimerase